MFFSLIKLNMSLLKNTITVQCILRLWFYHFRTDLRLDGLEDARVLEDENNDHLADKHGCPAYVSPEILHSTETYSGRAADIWSLGVMLYTMLVGRYPFHDSDPSALFGKIRRGQYNIPQMLSVKAKCLIRSLLRRDPSERLTAGDTLQHPWINGKKSSGFMTIIDHKSSDQAVPNVVFNEEEDFFLWTIGVIYCVSKYKEPVICFNAQCALSIRRWYSTTGPNFDVEVFRSY